MKKTFLMPTALLVAIVPLVMAAVKAPKGEEPGAGVAAVEVTTSRPLLLARGSDLTLPGRIKASEEVTLTSQISSRLTLLPFREGQEFSAGQTLAVFDSPESRRTLESARAGMSSATLSRDQARRQAARLDSLLGRGVASIRQLELAEADREAAEARWAEAQATLENLRQDTRLTVPFNGIVVRRHVDPGALLSPGQAILDVRSTQVGEIEVAVPESELPRLSGGRAWYQIGESAWREARVVRIDGMIDFRTRTRVAHLKPLDGAGLEPGAYARIRLDDDGGNGQLAIPLTSLVKRGSLNGVYVVRDGRAWLRWLRIGRSIDGRVEVLAGLLPDDEYVVSPDNLADAAPVTVKR